MRNSLIALGASITASTVLLFTTIPPPCAAKPNCPLYGPIFPRAANLLQSPAMQLTAYTLDDLFSKYIDNANSTGSQQFSYAVEVFSGSEDRSLWSRYWTAPNLKTLNSTGVTKVDTNTVFRIGSITKVYTVLTFLATVGDGIWNDPVTKYIPEFQELADKNREEGGGSMFEPDWEEITVGSLASQTSGIMRDCMSPTNPLPLYLCLSFSISLCLSCQNSTIWKIYTNLEMN